MNMRFSKLIFDKQLFREIAGVGLFVGLVGGFAIGDRKVHLKYYSSTDKEQYDFDEMVCIKKEHLPTQIKIHTSIPFITGALGALLFPTLVFSSPFIMIDYFGDFCVADKLHDKFNSKYKLSIKKYHQYGPPNDTKYYAPSTVIMKLSKR